MQAWPALFCLHVRQCGARRAHHVYLYPYLYISTRNVRSQQSWSVVPSTVHVQVAIAKVWNRNGWFASMQSYPNLYAQKCAINATTLFQLSVSYHLRCHLEIASLRLSTY